MQEFEKLGLFYLGKGFDLAAGSTTEELILYDAKDLTTHGVVVGMTGSGKTGLCVALLEEAAIDGIPSIAIDPKGDIGNLLLNFPGLLPNDFRPWVDEAEAARKGLSPDDLAAKTAETWRSGLAQWGQDPARIRRLRDAVDMAIYTPGNTAGRPLQILQSFAAPSSAIASDSSSLRDRILSAVSGLLGLLGVEADPVQSREHILLSNIFESAWREGRSLDIAGIIQSVQKPPFEKLGVLDLESFFPSKERFGLAMRLNNLIASPAFSAWMEGEPLDIQRLLFTPDGKPRISILSIAHLSDAERMFFVTLLLGEVLSWVRAQSGTGSLRALLYMDEIYGYFPPTANPPSKTPMLTLLKQARAFGLGIVLSTQNPVDLDYKGLANAGTWFIGRLQTERDKARVMEGLEGALASAGGAFDRGKVEGILAGLGNRVFLMRNVHEDDTTVFQTRWALSYLRGPLTGPQIRTLMSDRPAPAGVGPVPAAAPTPDVPASSAPATARPASAAPAIHSTAASSPGSGPRTVLPPEIGEWYLRPRDPAAAIRYRPMAMGASKLHFVNAKSGVDAWLSYTHMAPFSDDGREAVWDQATAHGDLRGDLEEQQRAGAEFAELPGGASNAKNPARWRNALETYLYQNTTLDLWACPSIKLTSQPGEAEGDFAARVALALREKRDVEVQKLRGKYAPKLQTLQNQLRRAQEREERERSQAGQQKISAAISLGATVLGGLFGRKIGSAGNVSRAASTVRSASRIGKEQQDVARASETVAAVQERAAVLDAQVEQEIAAIQARFDPAAAAIEPVQLRPRKSDISVGAVGVVWVPWTTGADGPPEPVF